ncbi:uncharacterized protein LOC135688079 isoform X2 [Rhopilema esculentum]|uniref:uncharacterized protein LOC135688079 isoform X2 n=1 Tax=Rhopilema esculentum TaxID=499914 RepID=UPI0031D59A8A|eukprot:gene6705-12266_t
MEHYIDQTERLVTINKLLPELERFLRITLTNEQLSDKANTQREEFLAKLEALNKPPRLPPRPPVNHAGFSATTDYLSKQREISWMQNDPKRSATPPGAPYRSRRRQPSDDIGAIAANFHDGSSTSEDSNLLYAKIPNETGSDKYVDIEGLASNNKPPVPDRSPRVSLLKPAADDREPKRNSWKTNTNEIFLHNLENPTRSGPLTNIRTKTRLWCVLKKKNLYVFRDIQQPCDHIIDVMNYDIHVESSTSAQFRLSKPGSPSFSLAAEDSEDHRRWVEALENCKYVDIDSEMPPRSSGHGNNLIEDPAYEEPRDVIDKMKKNEMDAPKSPNDLYVDMNGSKRKPSDDYVDPSLHTPPLYHKLADLEYDAELPPMPLSSDEEVRGDDDAIVEEPRKFPQEQSSDGNISGSFQSYSSSEDEPPPLPKIKPRSSSVPPSYSVNNQSVNSLERKKSSSLGRKLEKDAFFNDATAVHIGVLHQRRFLAVGKKRYCKVKNEVMYVYRNPDNDEKPVLEVALHDVKVDPCEKETWKTNSFKIVQPTGETVYFAAETREELIHWLKVLVQEADKTKFSGKDPHMRFPSKSLLYPGDTIDSASNSSLERKDGAEDSEDTSLDSAATGSEASDEETSNSTRRKSLKKRKPFEKSPSQKKRAERDVDLDGYLHLERAGKWIRFWCKIKAKILEIHSSKSSKSAENTIAMAELNIVTLPKKVMEETNYFLFKLIWAEESLLFLARDMFEWKKWNEALKKFTKGKTENLELHLGLPNLPAPHRKDERDARSKKKKPVKNGHLKPIDVADTPQERKQFRGTLKRLKDEADNAGVDVFCDARDGFFVLASDALLEKKLMEVPVRKIKLHQKKLVVKDDRYIFEIQATNDSLALLAVKEEREFIQLVEVLWLLNAQVDGERGTIANTHVNKLKKQYKRRSIAFDSELIALETGDRSAFSKQRENIIGRPEKSISDDEHKRKTLKTPVKTDSKRPMKTSSSGKQSGGSRMSSLFKSLPRLRQKKYEFNAGDSVDGVPKIQFSGNVQEVKANEEGAEQLLDRHCKVSGKIFYAYEPGSE